MRINSWNLQKIYLIRMRGSICEGCHNEPALYAHHCLIHDINKYKKRKKDILDELDDPRNLMLIGEKCEHSGIYNGSTWRKQFWKIQCDRFGHDSMIAWLDSVQLKNKPKFE